MGNLAFVSLLEAVMTEGLDLLIIGGVEDGIEAVWLI